MRSVIKLELGTKTSALLKKCCVICTPGCCGMNAYNFSPLQIASFIYVDPNAEVLESEFEEYRDEFRALLRTAEQLGSDWDGVVGSVEGMNTWFNRGGLESFVALLWRNLELAPEMFRYSSELEEAARRRRRENGSELEKLR